MVTKILSGQSIRGLLSYNENKVAAGVATIIFANRFGTEINSLDFRAKLSRFESLTETNSRVKTNALHFMLSFDRDDKISVVMMQQIASEYMNKVGFGDQPYLVYLHKDVSHPHLHIVTTNMQADGKRIPIHNIGKTLSETARKELETQFGLVKADGRKKSEGMEIMPVGIQKAVYGNTPTKRVINNVVSAVVRSYKFTSLAEYNAVLKQFNVIAYRGKEETLMFEKKGLIYSIIDKQGKRVGIPFKASVVSGKPTMAALEKKYSWNEEQRKVYKEPLKENIDRVLKSYTAITKATFIAELAKQKINVVFRQNEQGCTYGLTFIDNHNKTVFNGSDLGKVYSAKAISERLSVTDKQLNLEHKTYLKLAVPTTYLKQGEAKTYLKPPELGNFLKGMLDKQTGDFGGGMPRKKKRKKKGQEPQQQQSL